MKKKKPADHTPRADSESHKPTRKHGTVDSKRKRFTDERATTLWDYLRGRDLAPATSLLFLMLLAFQVMVHFQLFYNKPVPGYGAQYFPEMLRHQNSDTVDWIATAAMLPGNAPASRAMRPVYPGFVTIAKGLGLFRVDERIKQLPPGRPAGANLFDYLRGMAILQAVNCLVTIASLWIFFALARRFGLPAFPAALATLVAGAGFGFSFWVVQAVPEVFGYFTVILCLAALVVGMERDQSNDTAAGAKQSMITWGVVGLILGILLLGKEVYSLPMFMGLALLFTRRWAGLAAFTIMTVLPTIAWNFYMVRIVGAYDPAKYMKEYGFVVWLGKELGPAGWGDRVAILWGNLHRQLTALVQAYAYVPVGLAVIGLADSIIRKRPAIPRQGLVLGAFFLTTYLLFLASNFIMPRLMFLTWPVIFFYAWLGIEATLALLTRSIHSEESRQMIIRYGQIAAAVGLIYLGTRQQFAWYYYG